MVEVLVIRKKEYFLKGKVTHFQYFHSWNYSENVEEQKKNASKNINFWRNETMSKFFSYMCDDVTGFKKTFCLYVPTIKGRNETFLIS